jgi:phage host-nuclease inhibitor protein Gam
MNAIATRGTRLKKDAGAVPQNLTEANRAVALIGTKQRAIDAAVARAEAKVAKIKQELEQEIAGDLASRKEQFDGLFAYASANRATLTVEGKTVVLSAGKFLWRFTPPAVAVDDDAATIAKFKKRGKTKYIRVIEELNREAMLADRAKLALFGIRFSQKEEFVVVPDGFEAKTELKKSRTIAL